MKFPDGRVILFDVKRTSVEVTERELVKCKNCKHQNTMEDYIEDTTAYTLTLKPVCDLGDDGWCCRGEKKE